MTDVIAGLSIDVFARTDIGHWRRVNEDRVIGSPTLCVVADGMGGHAAGEVASDLLLSRLAPLSVVPAPSPEALLAAIRQANEDVLAHGRSNPASAGLGCTFAGILAVRVGDEPHWAVFNVGDCRVYLYADGRLSRATTDHSHVGELVAVGVLSEDEARRHRLRNVVTRSLGTEPAPIVDIGLLPIRPGVRLLVCSDGLHGELPDEQIGHLLAIADGDSCADLLLAAALAAGGRDNVTLGLVTVGGQEDEPVAEITRSRPDRQASDG